MIELLTLIVLTLSLIVLMFYAWDTRRMANQQSKSFFTPSVSHELSSPGWSDSNCEICLSLTNHSMYEVKTLVHLDVLVDGIKLKHEDANEKAYQGLSYWYMCPKIGCYDGHFSFGKKFLQYNNIEWADKTGRQIYKHNVEIILSYQTYHVFRKSPHKSFKYHYTFMLLYYDEYEPYDIGEPPDKVIFIPEVVNVNTR